MKVEIFQLSLLILKVTNLEIQSHSEQAGRRLMKTIIAHQKLCRISSYKSMQNLLNIDATALEIKQDKISAL